MPAYPHHWSGVFNLLKFDHIENKERMKVKSLSEIASAQETTGQPHQPIVHPPSSK